MGQGHRAAAVPRPAGSAPAQGVPCAIYRARGGELFAAAGRQGVAAFPAPVSRRGALSPHGGKSRCDDAGRRSAALTNLACFRPEIRIEPAGASPIMSLTPETPLPPNGVALRPIPMLIFSSRWLQLPLYVGLIVAQCVYAILFLKELWHLINHSFDFTVLLILLAVLGLSYVVSISNLLVMVIVGGYETFVSRLNLQGHPDEPEWLSHVNASVLKIKLAMAIIGISSIHLLRTFIEAGNLGGVGRTTNYTTEGVMWQTIIHVVFVLSAIGIAWVDRISAGLEGTGEEAGHAAH